MKKIIYGIMALILSVSMITPCYAADKFGDKEEWWKKIVLFSLVITCIVNVFTGLILWSSVDKDMVASIFFVSLIVNMIATIMQLIYNKAD